MSDNDPAEDVRRWHRENNPRRIFLIRKKIESTLSDDEKQELEQLQKKSFELIYTAFPFDRP